MIKYRLICNDGHEFEGWFRSSAAFDDQAEAGHVSCPGCGSTAISKAIMAPSIATAGGAARRSETGPGRQKEIVAALRKLRAEVEARSTYVGDRFAEEARKIHYGDAEPRSVHGEASIDEVSSLNDEGVPVMPLPKLAKDLN
jgi:hypothetical protein